MKVSIRRREKKRHDWQWQEQRLKFKKNLSPADEKKYQKISGWLKNIFHSVVCFKNLFLLLRQMPLYEWPPMRRKSHDFFCNLKYLILDYFQVKALVIGVFSSSQPNLVKCTSMSRTGCGEICCILRNT